jgi:exonuclease V gamma subunit
MNTAELIYQKSQKLPEPIVIELLHYLEFLESKYIPQNAQETLAILQNPALMAQIKTSEKTFAAKTGFVPTEEQLNAFN